MRLSLVFLVIGYCCISTNVLAQAPSKGKARILTCEISNCPGDSLKLFSFEGVGFRTLQVVKSSKPNTYTFKLGASTPTFVFVGTNESNKKVVLTSESKDLSVKGDAFQLAQAKVLQSPLNDQYESVQATISKQTQQFSELIREYNAYFSDENRRNAVVARLGQLDQQKLRLVDSLGAINSLWGLMASLEAYQSFQGTKSEYSSELEHLLYNYYKACKDFKDPLWGSLPIVFESFKNYAGIIAGLGFQEDQLREYLDIHLDKFPKKGMGHQFALGGVVLALQEKQHPLFPLMAKRFVSLFPDAAGVANLQNVLKASAGLQEGEVAPDFTQNTPDGKAMALSSLRGKVVLVDFWASWCGPCRRENPNVVKLYEKYKSKGFDILGVSLDRTKEPWLQAIAKDNLTWNHVSDLKGWQNEVAQMYRVSSIPATVLLDAEGRIIARNLRGVQLEQKLMSIFGE